MDRTGWESTIAIATLKDGKLVVLRGNRGGISLAAKHIGAVSVHFSEEAEVKKETDK